MRRTIVGVWWLSVVVLAFGQPPSAAGAEGGDEPPKPEPDEKILSGYTSFHFETSIEQINKRLLDPMARAGFNAVSFKIRNGFDADNDEQVRKLTELIRACEERGLTFMAYDWSTSRGRIPDEHEAIPPFVAYDGKKFENRYSVIHWPVWKAEFAEALDLARLSRRLPIRAVKLDLERFHQITRPEAVSYDDATWTRYKKAHPDVPDGLAADERGPWLKKQDKLEDYDQWWREQLEKVAQRFEKRMHAINPDLWLGLMPANKAVPPHKNLTYEAVAPHLATERAPAIMDCWQYGLGYRNGGKRVRREIRRLKKLNPDNLVVQWLTPRGNYPRDLRNRGYHLAMTADGYSIWQMKMIWPGHAKRWELAPGHEIPDYWQTFASLNQLIRRDLARGVDKPTTLKLKPLKSKQVARAGGPDAGAMLNLNHQVPPLAPATAVEGASPRGPEADGPKDGQKNGSDQWISLREQATVYLYAERGDTLRIDLRQLTGGTNTVAYALLNDATKALAEGSITHEKRNATIEVKNVNGGSYALLLKSPTNAWFGVRVHDGPTGVSLEPEAYLMRPQNHQSVFWVTRSKTRGPAKVKVAVDRGQMIEASLNGGDPVTGTHPEPIVFELPEGKRAHRIELTKPDNLGRYGMGLEEVHITAEGAVEPFISRALHRRLRLRR